MGIAWSYKVLPKQVFAPFWRKTLLVLCSWRFHLIGVCWRLFLSPSQRYNVLRYLTYATTQSLFLNQDTTLSFLIIVGIISSCLLSFLLIVFFGSHFFFSNACVTNSLTINHNMLKQLPFTLFTLPALQVFCASENKLDLDPNMPVTSPLGEVDLSTNCIHVLPDALFRCSTLTSLSLSFVNPSWIHYPWSVIQQNVSVGGKKNTHTHTDVMNLP